VGLSSDSVLTPPVSGSAPGSGLGCESILSDSNLGYGYKFNLAGLSADNMGSSSGGCLDSDGE
jgi:hypothetical protein